MKNIFTIFFCRKSRGGISRRTPVVIYFLSSPWKKESSKERRRRQIEIFLRSGALGCSALKAELRIEGHGYLLAFLLRRLEFLLLQQRIEEK